jgi:hypothetical protein
MKCFPVKSRGFTTCGRGKDLAERRIGTSELVIGRADKAMRELHDKYYHTIHDKKNTCVAIMAVSLQLAS